MKRLAYTLGGFALGVGLGLTATPSAYADIEQVTTTYTPPATVQSIEGSGSWQMEPIHLEAGLALKVVPPLSHLKMTSPFGWRADPFTGAPSFHMGVDYGAPAGTPIYAIADGTVLHAGKGLHGRSNNLIIIEHEIDGQAYTSWYVHMYDNGVYVNAGQQVKAGDTIGAVGSNGYSTGPHLHFEIHPAWDTTGQNPLNPVVFLERYL